MQIIIGLSIIFLIIFIASYLVLVVYYPNNYYFKDLLIPLISAFLSVLIAVSIQNNQNKEDINKAHSDTIKQLVIQPLINILSDKNPDLPDLEDIDNIRMIENNGLNFLLCKDFMNNHQTKIKDLWTKTRHSLDELDREKDELTIKIKKEIETLFHRCMDIGYPIDQVSHIKKVETGKFEKQLISELLEGSFNQEEMVIKFTQLLYPEKNVKINVLDEFEGILDPIRNYMVILSSTKDNDPILMKIRGKIITEINDLNRLFKKLNSIQLMVDKNKLELLTELNYLKYKSNFDLQKCDFVTKRRF